MSIFPTVPWKRRRSIAAETTIARRALAVAIGIGMAVSPAFAVEMSGSKNFEAPASTPSYFSGETPSQAGSADRGAAAAPVAGSAGAAGQRPATIHTGKASPKHVARHGKAAVKSAKVHAKTAKVVAATAKAKSGAIASHHHPARRDTAHAKVKTRPAKSA